MSQLFQRAARIIVDSVLVEGLRAQFKVTKTLDKTPNTCDVAIFNLSEESRAAIQGKGSRVIVEAGYAGSLGAVGTVAQIFSGDARTADHIRDGANWVTKVQCGDGERAYRYTRLSESFRPGTRVADVFAYIARSSGLDASQAIATVRSLVNEEYVQGRTVFGALPAELDKILRGRGLEWSVQDGRLQVLETGKPTRDSAVLLTPETGLIGSPEHGTPDKKGKPPTLKVKSLLQPSIRPGCLIRVEAKGIKGDFRVRTVSHSGDTAAGEWYSEIEATPHS